MRKRATTREVHAVGRIVAAVYRNGGVTRKEAMTSYDQYDLRQEDSFRIEKRRSAGGQVLSLVGIKWYKMHRNELEGESGRDRISI